MIKWTRFFERPPPRTSIQHCHFCLFISSIYQSVHLSTISCAHQTEVPRKKIRSTFFFHIPINFRILKCLPNHHQIFSANKFKLLFLERKKEKKKKSQMIHRSIQNNVIILLRVTLSKGDNVLAGCVQPSPSRYWFVSLAMMKFLTLNI